MKQTKNIQKKKNANVASPESLIGTMGYIVAMICAMNALRICVINVEVEVGKAITGA